MSISNPLEFEAPSVPDLSLPLAPTERNPSGQAAFAAALRMRAELWSGGTLNVQAGAAALTAEVTAFQRHVAQAALRRLPFRRAAVHKVLRAMREVWPRAKVGQSPHT